MTFLNGVKEESPTYHYPRVNTSTFFDTVWRKGFAYSMNECSNFPKLYTTTQFEVPLKAKKYWMFRCIFPHLKIDMTNIEDPQRYQKMIINIFKKGSMVANLIIYFLGYFSHGMLDYEGFLFGQPQ